MGILNLLKELSPATRDAHLSQFAGQTLGVDAMCWLHRAAFSCPLDLARSEMDPSTPHPLAYLRWIQRMLTMCSALQVKLIVVFDGAALPAKRGTNEARDTLRAQHRARADALYAAGQREAAAEAYGRCISVTPAMRRNTQHLLRSQGVPFLVAPFEADAQLGFLYRSGAITAAITSDSDLLAFGCERLLLKLDREGNARLLELAAVIQGKWDKHQENLMWKMQRILLAHRNLEGTGGAATSAAAATAASSSAAAATAVPAAASSRAASSSSPSSSRVSLSAGHSRFLLTCVLSGCDYLPSLHGIGLKKAAALVDEHRLIEPLLYNLKDQRKKLETKWRKEKEKADRAAAAAAMAAALAKGPSLDPADDDDAEAAALAAASADTSSRMSTSEYIAHFFQALLTFQHQLVYDPATKRLVHLTPLPPQLQKSWDEHLASASAGSNVKSGSSSAASEKEVIDLDADEDAAESKEALSPDPPTASSSTSYSAAFPTFRDVTTATARWEESQGLASPSAHPLVEGHPLLQLRDFAFLGSIMSQRIRDASHAPSASSSSAAARDRPSIEEWITGRVDTRTFLWHDDDSTGFQVTDLNSAESERRSNSGSKQQQPYFKRNFSDRGAVPTPPPAGPGISAFFVRSASALPNTSSRVGLFGAPASSGRQASTASHAGASPAPTSFRAAPIWLKSAGASGGDELDDLFGPAAPTPAATAPVQGAEECSETQRLDELDDDEQMAAVGVAADGEGEGRGLSGTFTPPPASAAAPPASVPSPSRNPFVCQPLRAVESVATFADLSPSPSKSGQAMAAAGALAPSSLLSKLASSSQAAAAASAASPSASSLSSAFSAGGRHPMFTLVKASPLVMPKLHATAAAATGGEEEVCDLTTEAGAGAGSASLKRKQSAPPAASVAAPAVPRSSSPFKRNKHAAGSSSSIGQKSVSSSPLLNFFRKST